MSQVDLSKYDIIWACQSDQIFGPWFKGKPSWQPWLTFLKHLFGLIASPRELAEIQLRTGRLPEKRHRYNEAWLVVGRRGGKSFILAVIAVYLTFFVDWKKHLAPGEFGTIVIVAADKKQARVILRYIKGLVNGIAFFRQEKMRETQGLMEFPKQRLAIEIFTTSFRATRGYTIVAALLDEVAFWRSEETTNPDEEIINAIRPGMATMPNAMLLAASSPYAKRGVLYKHFNDYLGKDEQDIMVWHADTKTMNPAISQAFLDRQYERDPLKAAAEYGAQFRADIEDFISEEVVDALIQKGVFQRPYGYSNTYAAFADPSGGSSDSFTLAIGHSEDGDRVLDVLREWRAPFQPEEVVKECSDTMKEYRVSKVRGDHYAGNWPKERFRKNGIVYEPCEQRKSDLYRDALPLLNTGVVQLLDSVKMKTQICSLERKQSRGGKFMIDHPPGGQDDLANAVLGLFATMAVSIVDYTEEDFLIGQSLVGLETPMNAVGKM